MDGPPRTVTSIEPASSSCRTFGMFGRADRLVPQPPNGVDGSATVPMIE
nr:hypothetical protein [Kibdelosporangium sp. MJ126-NF4]CTQ91737.1 hypothetical protein [Kibdelosporangium sp. MJ126-NF4]